jgi:hypothetical protein
LPVFHSFWLLWLTDCLSRRIFEAVSRRVIPLFLRWNCRCTFAQVSVLTHITAATFLQEQTCVKVAAYSCKTLQPTVSAGLFPQNYTCVKHYRGLRRHSCRNKLVRKLPRTLCKTLQPTVSAGLFPQNYTCVKHYSGLRRPCNTLSRPPAFCKQVYSYAPVPTSYFKFCRLTCRF